jgi:hypothetical protein
MMKKQILVLTVFSIGFCSQTIFAQNILPLGLRFETITNYDNAEWRWTPTATFRLTGPVNSSANITVEYTNPTGTPWVTAKCKLWNAIEAGKNFRFDQCGNDIDASKAINQTGIFKFQIKMSDPLSGTNKTLYTGKFTIGKMLYNINNEPEKNKQFHYFVDNDFRLGYAYVGTWFGDLSNDLYAEFWVKNKIMDYGKLSGYLFYNGKQVSEISPSFMLKLHPKENPKESFELVGLRFQALMEKPVSDGWDEWHKVYQSPGEYEIKLMREGKLIRSAKFSVGTDGKLINNNVGRELVGGTDILVPAQILGTIDGNYNKLAWKDGIFGNPISNLIVP